MKLKKIILILIILIFPFSAFAETVTADVHGMVCAFCSQGITAKLKENEAVEDVKVSLEEKKVTITFKEGKSLTDDEIKAIITKAGYDVKGIERKA